MKLYVDDIRRPPDDTWELARTNSKAIRILATQEVSEISIDHDICVCDVGKKPFRLEILEENFTPVVYYLTAMPEDRRPKSILIHSANPVGAKSMERVLGDAGIACVVSISSPPGKRDLEGCALSDADLKSLSEGVKVEYGDSEIDRS